MRFELFLISRFLIYVQCGQEINEANTLQRTDEGEIQSPAVEEQLKPAVEEKKEENKALRTLKKIVAVPIFLGASIIGIPIAAVAGSVVMCVKEGLHGYEKVGILWGIGGGFFGAIKGIGCGVFGFFFGLGMYLLDDPNKWK